MTTELIIKALLNAVHSKGIHEGLVHHSVLGCQLHQRNIYNYLINISSKQASVLQLMTTEQHIQRSHGYINP